MAADHYTVLQALLRAEAARSAPKPESDRMPERSGAHDRAEQPRQNPNRR